ncbi:structural cement protein Gp24 [Yersinia pekkanenii]|uniref:Uncharacterized protein n=1 Tax=Yersinia pekkanenii TaxID=1288385 RepID=A0A0T9R787_9GAMM|nr:hypothetical protein [Yersinia pekkanenii]CNI48190.1 Uncharacterised protein [Yersinia pekkanenii]CRY68205.1 Uncharacterised protein [Yersinia pekkanenii]
MNFQQKVRFDQAFGLVGEVSFDGPLRAKPGVLNSEDPANNVFGRAFTVLPDGSITAGGTGSFWGILANPKAHMFTSRIGDDGNNTLPNGVNAEFVDMAIINVEISTPTTVGSDLFYATETGALRALPPGTAAPEGHLAVPNAKVARLPQTNANGGLIVAQLTN